MEDYSRRPRLPLGTRLGAALVVGALCLTGSMATIDAADLTIQGGATGQSDQSGPCGRFL